VLPPVALQLLQVLTLLVFSPLVTGMISRAEAMLQARKGPSILQPYYDIRKMLRKGRSVPEDASWVYFLAPYVAFAAYVTIAMLIPVLTNFPLPLGYMGDILGGAFLFALAGFFVALAGLDSGSPYAGLGASRTMMVTVLVEPTLIFVFFTVAFISKTDLPYVMGETLRESWSTVFSASHVLAMAAFFLMILVDTGRIPIESSTSTLEFGMIDEARIFEHSGPEMALLKWGSFMKQFLLYTIFVNVLVFPWGLSGDGRPLTVLLALVLLLAKMVVVAAVVVGIESSFAKLRLFKIPEFMGAGFILSVLAIVVFYLGRG
jgi:formate hydrogenlyase subunit 4